MSQRVPRLPNELYAHILSYLDDIQDRKNAHFRKGVLRPLYRKEYKKPVEKRYRLTNSGTRLPKPQVWPTIPNPTNMWNAQTTQYFMFVEIIRALSITNHQIDVLDIKGHNTGISHRIFITAPVDYRHVTNVFTYLTTIHLTIDTHGSEGLWLVLTLRGGRLARALNKARNLKSLELRFMSHNPNMRQFPQETEFDFGTGLPSRTWPDLHHFGLLNVEIDDHHAFLAFIARHVRTLRSLRFECIALIQTTWEATLDDFLAQGVQLDNCQTATLYNDSEDSSVEGNEIIEFLRGNTENPCS
ncbi:MAG: hypothetical protein Q9191_006159 [Dirinaria sp. TL-2023a]